MSEGAGVDWELAGRVARTLAGGEHTALSVSEGELTALGSETLGAVLEYTGLSADEAPPPRLVGRHEWIAANLDELRRLATPLERTASEALDLPWPLGRLGRGAVGAAAGVEVGVALGYAARRVVGQVRVPLDGSERPLELLVVGANARRVAAELQADERRFLEWVLLHEQTHVVQFGAAPWLRAQLADLVRGLVESASAELNLGRLAGAVKRVLGGDPRQALGRVLRGELARALASPEQQRLLDRLQATMALLEGYAEHVMDAASTPDEELARLRASLDARRARRAGLGEVLARALGLGMKLEQYERGKRFCDAVAAAAGIAALNGAWSGPEALPSPRELDEPGAWLERVQR